jgi:uncharacterized membrane protein
VVTLYEFFLLVHILAAIVWVGGNATLNVLGMLVRRERDPAQMLRFLGYSEFVGSRVIGTAAVFLLAFGIALVERGDWGYDGWIIAALVIYAISSAIGGGFYGRQKKKIERLAETDGLTSPAVVREIARYTSVAWIDLVLVIAAVTDMVIKPTF